MQSIAQNNFNCSASTGSGESAIWAACSINSGMRRMSSSTVRRRLGCRRVIHRIVDHATDLAWLTVNTGDARFWKGPRHREAPQCHHQLGLDQLDLPVQVRLAGFDLLGQRVAIARRTALDDVGDKDLRAFQANTLEQFIEKVACRPHEREALLILVEARGLTDEHDLCIRRAHTGHRLGPSPVQEAPRTPGNLRRQRLQL
jgi:hypothetical protein